MKGISSPSFVGVLLLICCSSAFAVDKKKFRTCDQTSFCRRHRANGSARLYEYALLKDSLVLHSPSVADSVTQEDQGDKASGEAESPLWKSMKRMLGAKEGPRDPYVRGPSPVLTGTLINKAPHTSSGQANERLELSLHVHDDGIARMRITEEYGTAKSAFEKARVTYDDLVLNLQEMKSDDLKHISLLDPSTDKKTLEPFVKSINGKDASNYVALQYGSKQMTVLMQIQPFAVHMFRSDLPTSPILSMGTEQMMHFEIRRTKDAATQPPEPKEEETQDESKAEEGKKFKDGKEIVGYWEDGLAIYADGTREERVDHDTESETRKLSEGELDLSDMWEESFGSHKDSKPHGPTSVGMDISFPGSKHIFGIPEHASSTSLLTTTGEGAHYSDPYRLYNLDVFEYELDETMALYGNVPLVVSHSVETGTVGIFWFNPTETFVDVLPPTDMGSTTHWMSESGIIDLFLIPGPSPTSFYEQYAHLTGRVELPPMFSLGYHQCRWNYKDEKDVYQVHGKFEELDYPYDVLWLDIEHTDGKRYFTWDSANFPHPKAMQEKLDAQARNMVTIIDPHIKRDNHYYIHKEATSKGLYVKDNSGKKDFDGWCWPGSSSYLDFTAEKVRSWWADQFSYNSYDGSTPSLYTWNDMNEPSVFNGPEVTMQKDLLNLNGEEHREWHNLYGMLFHRATSEGLVRRNSGEDKRPFVLSRAFYAGSQKYGAIWTGDNESVWPHLEISPKMLLSLNIAALSFVGADVGGFFGNPDAELMTRWMQAGAYQPFFRGHAHHDAKRREPWMFGHETMVRLRHAAMARYALLPYWYTVFRFAGVTGMPVMRTMWMQYPTVSSLFDTDDQYMIGSDLLVKPVVSPGATEVEVSLPAADLWYDVDSMQLVPTDEKEASEATSVIIPVDIDKIPVYQRGGSVIPRKLRLRRSSRLMKTDPYTLYVALDNNQKASGTLYMDDEETFEHQRNHNYAEAFFSVSLEDDVLFENIPKLGAGWNGESSHYLIERIVVMGVSKPPHRISANKQHLEFNFDANAKTLVIRKPLLSAVESWKIVKETGK